MQNIQDVWIRIQETKKEQKNIAQMYKDALENLQEYKEVTDKIKGFSLRKKELEGQVKTELGSQYEKLHSIKKEIQLDKELLADIAISNLMKGEQVTITDPENNHYEPVYSVKFKKVDEVNKRTEHP